MDLRCLRPLDSASLLASVAKTHRALIVDESWKTGGMNAEVSALLAEQAFWHLDAPIGRVGSVEVPIPYAGHLEKAALPSTEGVVAAAKRLLEGI